MSRILPNLYLGSWDQARDFKWLVNNKITHILNTAGELENLFTPKFVYKHTPCRDINGYCIRIYFDEMADFIHEALQKGAILVHCYRGISRSCTAVIVYLLKYKNMDYTSAKKLCRSKRPITNPNNGFVRQIIEYEMSLIKQKRSYMIDTQYKRPVTTEDVKLSQ